MTHSHFHSFRSSWQAGCPRSLVSDTILSAVHYFVCCLSFLLLSVISSSVFHLSTVNHFVCRLSFHLLSVISSSVCHFVCCPSICLLSIILCAVCHLVCCQSLKGKEITRPLQHQLSILCRLHIYCK